MGRRIRNHRSIRQDDDTIPLKRSQGLWRLDADVHNDHSAEASKYPYWKRLTTLELSPWKAKELYELPA